MSARDDHRYLAGIEQDMPPVGPARWRREAYTAALDEIDNLRRWKAEAMHSLGEWQQCYDTLAGSGRPAPLGKSMARHVAGYVKVTVS